MGATFSLGLGYNDRGLIEEFVSLQLTSEIITESIDGEVYDVYWKDGQVIFEPTDPGCVDFVREDLEKFSGVPASWKMIDGLCDFHVPGYEGSEITINRPGSVFHEKRVGSLSYAVAVVEGMFEDAQQSDSCLHEDLELLETMRRTVWVADALHAVFTCG